MNSHARQDAESLPPHAPEATTVGASARIPASVPRGRPGAPIPDLAIPAAFWLFRLTVWSVLLVLLSPQLLSIPGWHGAARWLARNDWARVLAFVGMLPFLALSAFSVHSRPRPSARGPEAGTGDGGRVLDGPRIGPALGLSAGPGTAWERDGWSIEVREWRERGRRRIVACAEAEAATGFGFAAHSTAGVPGVLRGPLEAASESLIRRQAERLEDPQAAAAFAAVGFLGRPPIDLGVPELERAVVVRASDAGVARELFRCPAVARALRGLPVTNARWEWTLYPTRQPGRVELRFAGPAGPSDPEHARRIRDLMHAALLQLARAGVLRSR